MPSPASTAWLAASAKLGLSNGALLCTVSRGRRRGLGGGATLTPCRPLSDPYVRRMVARMALRAAIARRVTPRTLRHTFTTPLLRKTGNLELFWKALHHACNTPTAQIYSHLVASDVEEAVQGLRGPGEPYTIAQPSCRPSHKKYAKPSRACSSAAGGNGLLELWLEPRPCSAH